MFNSWATIMWDERDVQDHCEMELAARVTPCMLCLSAAYLRGSYFDYYTQARFSGPASRR